MNEKQNAKRLAVVIGNSEYENLTKLDNAINDAEAAKNTLQSLGFEVSLGINLQRNEMLKCFSKVLDPWRYEASEIVIYYSGHGNSIDGRLYLGPVDASRDLSTYFDRESYLSVEIILETLLECRQDEKLPIIFILDCCRSEYELSNTRSYDQRDSLQSVGGKVGVKSNIAILFSTPEGQIALDGNRASMHSPYTQSMLKYMNKDWTLEQIHNAITKYLGESSQFHGKQMPWMHQCLYEPYKFCRPTSAKTNNKLSVAHLHLDDPAEYNFHGVPAENQNFVHRPEIFARIEAVFDKRPSGGCRILALSGLGGMGKTQLMLRHCYLHRASYEFVFWLEVDGWSTALESFRKLAVRLGLNEESAKEKCRDERIIDWVCAWLQKKTRWLLLLDNVDEVTAAKIFEYLPRVGGDIVLTTREYISPTKAKVIRISKMGKNEALALLVGSTEPNRNSAQFRYAKDIIAELDSMPLAVDLARAYIDCMQISFKEYLSVYKRGIIFTHRDQDNLNYNYNLSTVWKISFDRIRTENPVAALILDACAFFQPEQIPVSFFERQYSVLARASNLSLPSTNSDNFRQVVRSAIAILLRFSFVTRTSKDTEHEEGPTKDTLTIHRLVQKVIYDSMADEQKIRWAGTLVSAFNCETNFSDSYASLTRITMNAYLPHIRHLVTMFDFRQKALISVDIYELLWRTVHYLLYYGVYFGEEELAKLTVSTSKHDSNVTPCDPPPSPYDKPSGYGKSQPLYRRALAHFEKALGPERIDSTASLNKLASLYESQGHYAKTEMLYQRGLELWEKALASENLDTVAFLNKLAILYENKGSYAKAESLYQRALEIREKTLGPEHPDTAMALSDLALLYFHQGHYAKAEPLYLRALETC